MQGIYWVVSKDFGMNKLWILGVLNSVVKIQGEPQLVQANEGQELAKVLGSPDESSCIFKGDSPTKLGLESE